MEFRWSNGNKHLSIENYYKYCKENRMEQKKTGDLDLRIEPRWGIFTNGARKGWDTCLDVTIALGYIEINYTNYDY
jgi:hypothetical protein